jgi:hypothetical protein
MNQVEKMMAFECLLIAAAAAAFAAAKPLERTATKRRPQCY